MPRPHEPGASLRATLELRENPSRSAEKEILNSSTTKLYLNETSSKRRRIRIPHHTQSDQDRRYHGVASRKACTEGDGYGEEHSTVQYSSAQAREGANCGMDGWMDE